MFQSYWHAPAGALHKFVNGQPPYSSLFFFLSGPLDRLVWMFFAIIFIFTLPLTEAMITKSI